MPVRPENAGDVNDAEFDRAVERLRAGRNEASGRFDASDLDVLPDPARRFLTRVLPPDTPLADEVELTAHGSIRLGSNWWPFRSTQVLLAGAGFVWRPVVHRGPMRVTGADTMVDGSGSMDFRLFGLVPVARSSGPDTDRSAAGRLAVETVAWLPQAVTPRRGVRWTAVDEERATVSVPTPAGSIDVTITVDDDGRLLSTATQRWGDRTSPPSAQPFGGPAGDEFVTDDGVRVMGAGSVGWGWETDAWPDGEFFRFRLDSVTFR